jgi:hypothetical protein
MPNLRFSERVSEQARLGVSRAAGDLVLCQVSELRAVSSSFLYGRKICLAPRLFWSCQISAPLVYSLYPCEREFDSLSVQYMPLHSLECSVRVRCVIVSSALGSSW